VNGSLNLLVATCLPPHFCSRSFRARLEVPGDVILTLMGQIIRHNGG